MSKECSFEGCSNVPGERFTASGYCGKHQNEAKKAGHVQKENVRKAVESATFSRTVVQSVEVLPADPEGQYVIVEWNTPDPTDRPMKYVVSAEDYEDALTSPEFDDPLDAVAALAQRPRLYSLLDDGPDVFNDVPWESEDVMEGHPLLGDPVNQLKDGTFDPDKVVIFDGWDHAFLRPGDPKPLNRVMRTDHALNDDSFDLDKAEDVLENHPWVKNVYQEPGQRWGMDYNPGRLVVDFKVPDEVWDAMVEWDNRPGARKHMRGVERPGRTHMMPDVSMHLIWAVIATEEQDKNSQVWSDKVGKDPLGLSVALRSEPPYRYGEEEDSGYW